MHHQVEIVNNSLPGCYKNNTYNFKKKETNQGQLMSSTN